jgi:hypothetical protein
MTNLLPTPHTNKMVCLYSHEEVAKWIVLIAKLTVKSSLKFQMVVPSPSLLACIIAQKEKIIGDSDWRVQ